MEVRSSRRMRTLVTQMVHRGLSANENACALISMMARSKCSNQRPDTLMQDRKPTARRNPLVTRGRTIQTGQKADTALGAIEVSHARQRTQGAQIRCYDISQPMAEISAQPPLCWRSARP